MKKPKGKRNRKATEQSNAEHTEPKLTRLLDIPPSAIGTLSQIEISGNREAIVDGCQGILEYDENVIKLTTGKMGIKFSGRNLQVKVLTHDSAIVAGFIMAIEFLL